MADTPAPHSPAPDPELSIEELADMAQQQWNQKSIYPGDEVLSQMRSVENDVAELVYELGGSSTGVGRRASEVEELLNDCKRQATEALGEAEDIETKIKGLAGAQNVAEIAENVDLDRLSTDAQDIPQLIARPMSTAFDAGDMLRRVSEDLADKELYDLMDIAEAARKRVMTMADELNMWQDGAASAAAELETELIAPLNERIGMEAPEPKLEALSSAPDQMPDTPQPTVQPLHEPQPEPRQPEPHHPQPSKGWTTEFGL